MAHSLGTITHEKCRLGIFAFFLSLSLVHFLTSGGGGRIQIDMDGDKSRRSEDYRETLGLAVGQTKVERWNGTGH